MTISRIELLAGQDQKITSHKILQFLSVTGAHGCISVYALVDETKTQSTYHFDTYGTGWECPEDGNIGDFIGTAVVGAFVWHVFYTGES